MSSFEILKYGECMLTSIHGCIWCKVQIAGQESETNWPMPGIGSLSLMSKVCLFSPLWGFTFRSGCCPESLTYLWFSLVCKCNVGVPIAALCFRAMSVPAWKCALDILILVLFILDSRARGSVASEGGSCQRQGTVGKRTQNWRYPTRGHGNIDWSVVVCDESTELTRLTLDFLRVRRA